MEKNLYIDASHPNETRIVLKSDSSIDELDLRTIRVSFGCEASIYKFFSILSEFYLKGLIL